MNRLASILVMVGLSLLPEIDELCIFFIFGSQLNETVTDIE